MQYLKQKSYQEVEMYRFGYSPVGKPWLSVYCYKLGDTLIDTAQRNCEELVLRTFQDTQLSSIILTHWHEDHSGNANSLAQVHQAKVFAPNLSIEKLKNGFDILPYERFLFGKIQPITQPICPLPDEIQLENHRLIPIHTPGHAEDHTVFLEPDKGWLFSGDLFVGVEIKVFRNGESFWQQVESFRNVLTYDFEVLFCGHHPRLKDGKAWMQRKLTYFETFGGQVRHLYDKGLEIKEIMREMQLKENHLLRLLLSNDVSVRTMVEAAVNEN